MIERVADPLLLTQIRPLGATATLRGALPTVISATFVLPAVSKTLTESLSALTAHTRLPALRTQPENTMAQESLFDAFRRKVALLQDTIALMNEMRKGNQAGAARLAESEKS